MFNLKRFESKFSASPLPRGLGVKVVGRPGNNSMLSGILGFGSKIFCEKAVVATFEKASNICINFKILKVE